MHIARVSFWLLQRLGALELAEFGVRFLERVFGWCWLIGRGFQLSRLRVHRCTWFEDKGYLSSTTPLMLIEDEVSRLTETEF